MHVIGNAPGEVMAPPASGYVGLGLYEAREPSDEYGYTPVGDPMTWVIRFANGDQLVGPQTELAGFWFAYADAVERLQDWERL